MTILLPTTCWMIGVNGWKLNQRVTLIGSLPTAGVMELHPGPGGGRVPRPPRGPLGTPLPAALGSVMKIQPVLAGGSWAEPCGFPPLGMGPLGHGLASTSVTAFAWTAVATSASVGHVCVEPLGSMK